MYTQTLILSILILCAGCSTVGTSFKSIGETESGKTITYLYLECQQGQTEYLGDGTTGASVYINNKFIGYLSQGTYIPLALNAGIYKFKFGSTWNWSNPTLEFTFSVGRNETRYVEWNSRWDESRSHTLLYEVTERSEAESLPTLKTCLLEQKTYLKAKNMGLSL